MKMKSEEFSRWDAADYLNSEEDIHLYLEACVEEDEGDGALISAALGDIARARNMTQLAADVGVTRAGLYKALSGEGNPSFSLMLKVTRALGMEMHITPVVHS